MALRDLIEWYRPLLRAMANRELDSDLRPKVDVSDVVQEACTDLARSFDRLKARNRYQFLVYMQTVVSHAVDDLRRRFKGTKCRNLQRERTFNNSGAPSVGESELGSRGFTDATPLPLDQLIYAEHCERLQRVLSRLPRELQRLLRWRFRKGMTYQEIGARLDRTEDDVRMLIKRCLNRMRSEVFPDVSSQ